MNVLKILMVILVFLVPGPAFCDPGSDPVCEKETFTKPLGSFTHKGVNCKMKIDCSRNSGCGVECGTFYATLTGGSEKLDHKVTCTVEKVLLGSIGTYYSCKWNRKNGSRASKDFNWMAFGKTEWTCQYVTDWVLEKP